MAGLEQIPMMGGLTQFSGADVATNVLNAPLERQARDLQGRQFSDAVLMRAVQMGGDSPEAWDAEMKKAAEQGVPEAAKFVGKWNPLTVDRLQQSLGARTQSASATGGARSQSPMAAGPMATPGIQGSGPGGAYNFDTLSKDILTRSYEGMGMFLDIMRSIPGEVSYNDFTSAIDFLKANGHPEAEQMRAAIPSELSFANKFSPLIRGIRDTREKLGQRLAPEQMGLPYQEPQPTYSSAVTEAGPMNVRTPIGGGPSSYEFPTISGKPNPAFLPQPRTGGRASGAADVTLNEQTLRRMAEQYLGGDRTVFQNLGRGAQGSANVVALREMVGTIGEERGLSGGDIARIIGEFEGFKAGQRSMGTRGANVLMAATEAGLMADIVTETSDAVDRTEFPNLNAVANAVSKGVGGVEVVKFNTALNSFINVYARAIAPSGQGPTVSDKEHAREMLNIAYSKGQVGGAIDIMLREIEAAKATPGKVKKEFGDQMGYGSTKAAPKTETKGDDLLEWEK